MPLERIFILRSERKRNFAVVIEDSVVLARSWILQVESAIEGGPLVVSKAEAAFPLLIECELAVPVVRARRRHSFTIDEVSFVAVSEGGGARFERALLEIVKGSLAAE